jgi:hypothetical protein
VRAKRRDWSKENLRRRRRDPEKRDQALEWRYHIPKGGLAQMREAQGGRCANPGCRAELGEDWNVDHDHRCCDLNRSCGRCVRGLLCRSCNSALGYARDDPDRLAGLVEYLAAPPYQAVSEAQAGSH